MSDLKLDLASQTVLVAGGGSGAGKSIALALAANGAAVALGDLNIERADAAAEAILAGGGTALALHCDVSNRFQVANMIEQTRDAYGAIDLLVNAASIFHAEPMLTIDEWNWRRQIEVNISGVFFCMQLVARVMAEEGGGSIVNLVPAAASESTLPAGIGSIAGGAGVIGMTRQAARELAAHGIRVNCIAASGGAESGADVAGAALFLVSEAAKTLTGQVLPADGAASWRAWQNAAST